MTMGSGLRGSSCWPRSSASSARWSWWLLTGRFPDAAIAPAQYRSSLAGSLAWLAPCVEDFFANGGKYSKFVTTSTDGAIEAGDVTKISKKEYKVGVNVSVNVTLLRKDLEAAGIIKDVRRREHYLKPSIRKKEKRIAAEKRRRRSANRAKR